MFSLSHKAKQYLLVALKVLILVGTFYYIYYKLNITAVPVRETVYNAFNLSIGSLFYYAFFLLILFGACNPANKAEQTEKKDPLKYVDPFICTKGDNGHSKS